MKLFAHRGVSDLAPENTMPAFQLALEQGAHGIETDVQLTKDGVPVLVHDERLGRTVEGSGWIGEHTWKELSGLDAGAWFHSRFTGTRIPRLEELLEWALSNDLELNLELKNSIIDYTGLERIVIEQVARYGLEGRVILSSFNHESLRRCKQLHFGIPTGLLYEFGVPDPMYYVQKIGADGLHPSWPWALPHVVQEAHRLGRPVRAYTVNHLIALTTVAAAKVDAVFTDHPAQLRSKMSSIGL